MRKLTWIFMISLGTGSVAHAQTAVVPDPKRWDISGTAAVFEVRPNDDDTAYGDDWYFAGRYAVVVGRYWTEHLKTEFEYATSNEGSTYLQRFTTVPGGTGVAPYSVESFHRLDQGSLRLVWQFGRNAWVHPYVSGGLVVERDRRYEFVPAMYGFPPGRTTGAMILSPEFTTDRVVDLRVGVTAGAGAKIYMSQNAFFNTGFIATYAKPVGTISLLAGFGVDF